MRLVLLERVGGFVQISFGGIGSILVPYFRHIIILIILRLNEGFSFLVGGGGIIRFILR